MYLGNTVDLGDDLDGDEFILTYVDRQPNEMDFVFAPLNAGSNGGNLTLIHQRREDDVRLVESTGRASGM